ncbi:hypothetical protein HDU98_011108, partial [Podochytrium sp. JEL0797]
MTGFFLTLFTGPLIGALPLFCGDPRNLNFRAHYMRGMSLALMIDTILIVVATFIITQSCGNNFSYYYNTSGSTYYSSSGCESMYTQILPIAVLWGVMSILLFRRSKLMIDALAANPGGLGAPVGMLVQVVSGYNTNNGQPQYAPQYAPQYQTANQQTYQPAGLPAYQEMAPGPIPNYTQPSCPPPGFLSTQPPPTTPNMGYAVGYSQPSFPPPEFSSTSSPTYASPSAPPQQPPHPYPKGGLSLESLALELQIPKLLNVTEGVEGVMDMTYGELKDKYAINGDEFLKIKAYRKT